MISVMTPDRLDACAELYVEVFRAPPWDETWRLEDARQRLSDFLGAPRSRGLCLAGPDGVLLGFALGRRERYQDEDHFLLQEMCVRPDQQGQGHGSALLEALTADLADLRHWYLTTMRDGPAAAFYARHGFQPAARQGIFVRP
ncbi:GNAT family N-acetyltransferase [Nocardioides dongkuii]|uniref:GNAT family N-acetyltransferase n=1 Tax=Nocardioides dongkuii TaxID=2760089 RepID=UPI0015FDEA5F|nr:GNAT family N-acetyltransferase [Nocardioides dongkuii]